MSRLAYIFVCVAVLAVSLPAHAQEPDIQALLNVLNATDIDTVARYFPPELQEAVAKLSTETRDEVNLLLPVKDAFRRENLTLEFYADEDGPLLLFDDPKGGFISHLEFYIGSREYGNDRSELTFLIKDRADSTDAETAILRLKYVYPDWRIYEAESPKSHEVIHLDDAKLVDKMIEGMLSANESSARSQILNYANEINSYAAMFPRRGVPGTLAQLGPPEELAEPDEQHAGLLSEALAKPPFEQHRYRFTYQRKGVERFTIVARPVKFGITGRQSYYIDETMKTRFTDKDKAPDALSKLVK